MIPLFLGLSLVNLLCLVTATALGYATAAGNMNWARWHILAGALSAITCCAVHCVVFTYFIATGKWVQHAVAVKRLDPNLSEPSRSFKAHAFPAAIIAMASVFITAVFGAATDNGYAQPLWHHLLALGSIVTNVVVAAVELSAIRKNGLLIDDVLAAPQGSVAQN
jgi:H+/gluconate symporter-like permease